MYIKYDELKKTLKEILMSRNIKEDRADILATIFTNNSLDGVSSHGTNRFPRFISYVDKKEVDVNSIPEVVFNFNGFIRMDGKMGIGPLNAYIAMEKACDLALEFGIGIVALKNTNHWMRGGTYGYLACDRGLVGICFSNTTANMVAYKAKEPKLGNNPLVIAIPRNNNEHVVLDFAISQYSYGKVSSTLLDNKMLEVPGGYDEEGNLSNDPEKILKTRAFLPVGYYKGAGLSLVLDLMATIFSAGNSVSKVTSFGDEIGLSQVFIAIDPNRANNKELTDKMIEDILIDFKNAKTFDGSEVSYPGENTILRRKENLEKGIRVVDSVWEEILALKK